MQQKQLKPFFLIPTKSFLPDSAPGLKQKTRPPAHMAESLGMEVVKVISDQTATGWPGAYLLYAEKMQ